MKNMENIALNFSLHFSSVGFSWHHIIFNSNAKIKSCKRFDTLGGELLLQETEATLHILSFLSTKHYSLCRDCHDYKLLKSNTICNICY